MAKNVLLPEDAWWLEDWIEEFERFPLGANDDQVDALSQALARIWLDATEGAPGPRRWAIWPWPSLPDSAGWA